MVWTKRFLEKQGYPIKENVLYQDNKSSILLESNGGASCGKHSEPIQCTRGASTATFRERLDE